MITLIIKGNHLIIEGDQACVAQDAEALEVVQAVKPLTVTYKHPTPGKPLILLKKADESLFYITPDGQETPWNPDKPYVPVKTVCLKHEKAFKRPSWRTITLVQAWKSFNKFLPIKTPRPKRISLNDPSLFYVTPDGKKKLKPWFERPDYRPSLIQAWESFNEFLFIETKYKRYRSPEELEILRLADPVLHFEAHKKCYRKEAVAILEGKDWQGKNRCVKLEGD